MNKINSQYDLFDLVAPIAIYHWADLTYGKKAIKALKEIKKLPKDIWQEFSLDNPNTNCDFKDLDSFASWALDTYNTLFENIFKQADENCVFGYDKWGAKTVKMSNGTFISGDTQGQYPWYEDSLTLIKQYLS